MASNKLSDFNRAGGEAGGRGPLFQKQRKKNAWVKEPVPTVAIVL